MTLSILINERIAEYNRHLTPGEEPMSQAHLARLLGISESCVSRWVNGRRSVPLKTAFRLAQALGCEITDLFEWEPEELPLERERRLWEEEFEARIAARRALLRTRGVGSALSPTSRDADPVT